MGHREGIHDPRVGGSRSCGGRVETLRCRSSGAKTLYAGVGVVTSGCVLLRTIRVSDGDPWVTRGACPVAISRRQFVSATCGLCVASVSTYAFGIAPHRLLVTRHRMAGGPGPVLRVAQLSDLHLKRIGPYTERVIAAVHEARPDLVLLTGDAIDRADALPVLAGLLALLPSGSARLAILGNWEHWSGVDLRRLAACYERAGWQLLRNASVRLVFGGAELLVTGLDDLVGGRPDVRASLHDHDPAPNHLLLAHCPTHREFFTQEVAAPPPLGARLAPVAPGLRTPQLMLAGHTHGGQLALGRWAPARPRGSGRYVAGWYRDDAIALYVSRGIGTSVLPVRLGAPPELVLIEWTLNASGVSDAPDDSGPDP